ncbi:MAG: PaaI family thioesterase [Actinomycetota bacterium]|nr:PaaI family thioesterase [Actinomycetota bacterium]
MSIFLEESEQLPTLTPIHQLGISLRAVQDRVSSTNAPPEIALQAARTLEEVASLLDEYRYIVSRDKSWDDIRRSGGSRTLAPEMFDVTQSEQRLDAKVCFSAFYLGGNGAVHGGAIPLLMDQVLGRVANHGRPICRTAYLNIDYRHVTPIDRDLRVECFIERIDGRKRYVYGAIYDEEILTIEAHGLFIELKPGAQ